MYPPARRALQALHIRRGDERGENVARSVHQIGTQLPRVVALDEAPQASVLDRAKVHMYGITVHIASVFRAAPLEHRRGAR